MNQSEKYFNKIQPLCMECGSNFDNEQVKRYGEYIMYEAFLKAGDSPTKENARIMLERMVQEDNLKTK